MTDVITGWKITFRSCHC